MFAYCNNNPVNNYDSSGTSPISYCNGNGDRNPLFIGYYGCGGGGGSGGYCGGGNSQYEDIFEEMDALKDKKLDSVCSYVEDQQNAQLQEAILLNEGVKTVRAAYDTMQDNTLVKMGKFISKNRNAAKLISKGVGLYCAPFPSMADEILGTGYVLAGILYSTFAWWEASA